MNAQRCVICDNPTDSTTRARIGPCDAPPDHPDNVTGAMCADCEFWCDGNIIDADLDWKIGDLKTTTHRQNGPKR